MYYLGISCFYHDSALVLLSSEGVVFASHEERFSRVKHDKSFPRLALTHCIDNFNITLDNISSIVFYENPLLKLDRKSRCGDDLFSDNNDVFKSFSISKYISHCTGWNSALVSSKLYFSSHHLSHAASSYYCSGLDSSAVLVIDAVGEKDTVSIYKAKKNIISKIWSLPFPQSVGLFYSTFTYFCGFKVNSGEYKLMGLAPYGKPVYADSIESAFLTFNDIESCDGSPLSIDSSLYSIDPTTPIVSASSKLAALLGYAPRLENDELTQPYFDLAASAQFLLNKIVLHLARYSLFITCSRNLCLAGGVALNCTSNSFIRSRLNIDNLFVQPASGDAGGALGAALISYYSERTYPSAPFSSQISSIFWGSNIEPDSVIKKLLDDKNIYHSFYNDIYDLAIIVSARLMSGQIVSLARGRAEFGPRALGHRSILADPRISDIKSRINSVIKYRESFRPFAPLIHIYNFSKYFDSSRISNPFMLFIENFLPYEKDTSLSPSTCFPGIRHLDDTARCQVISPSNDELHSLILNHCESNYSCDMLLNTSFNVRGEPLVNSALDALNTFFGTEIDCCVIGSFVIEKASNSHVTAYPLESWKSNSRAD